MDFSSVTVEELQIFLDRFYKNLNSRRRHYHYHEGNKAKQIESIQLKKCYVVKELEKYETDMLIVKYRTEDHILCSFNIVLEKMRDYSFMKMKRENKRNEKVQMRFPEIKGRFAARGERSEP